MKTRFIIPTLLAAALCLAVPPRDAGAWPPGSLDSTFGYDGIVTTSVARYSDQAYGVVVQTDGRIIAAGRGESEYPAYQDFVLVRYQADGSLDPTFDNDGTVTVPVNPSGDDGANDVTLQPDGKVVATGFPGLSVVRLNPEGTLDQTFGGGDGIVTGPGAGGYSVAIQPDGKIVVAGLAYEGHVQLFAVARFLPDGTLDPEFGDGGYVTTSVGPHDDFGRTLGLQSDGKIVVGGWSFTDQGYDFALVRYNADGSLDTSFGGGDGMVVTSLGPFEDYLLALALDDQGRIVATGYTHKVSPSRTDAALLRYMPDGNLDSDFGEGDGIVITDLGGDDSALAVSIQADGRIVAGGTARVGTTNGFALARYDSNGTLDIGFGHDGVVITPIGSQATANDLAIQANGGIVAAGTVRPDNYQEFAMARYLAESLEGSGVRSDFNGDGYSDLAVAAPLEDVGDVLDAGAVNVVYGSSKRLTSAGNELWTQNSPDVVDDVSYGELLGYAIAAGDFNGDGFADLAIGVPGEDYDGRSTDAGAVNVLYGSPDGLTATNNQFWDLATASLGEPMLDDLFGAALATGDLNGDGFADLAVGIPLREVSGQPYAGAVAVMYGSQDGLTATGSQLWSQDSPNVEDSAEFDDEFGSALAIGDFNGNGFGDLAIGAPLEGNPEVAGAVNVLYGSASGITATGDQLWTQDTSGIVDKREKGDVFGFALSAGSFEGDKYDDLAVGIPGENIGSKVDAGAIAVIYGRSSGLSYIRNQFWSQDTRGVRDTSERRDLFGYSVASGDFNGSGRDDVAIAAPLENVGSLTDAGAVAVLYGGRTKLGISGNQFWSQNSTSIRDTAERYDQFGISLAAGDFNGHKYDDLAVGANLEDLPHEFDAGAANVIYGSSSRLYATGNQFWNQDSSGILDTAEYGDTFGGALGSGEIGAQSGAFDLLRRFASWTGAR